MCIYRLRVSELLICGRTMSSKILMILELILLLQLLLLLFLLFIIIIIISSSSSRGSHMIYKCLFISLLYLFNYYLIPS